MFIDKGKTLNLISDCGKLVTVRLQVNPRAKRLILRLDPKSGEAVAVAPSKRELKRAAAFAKSKLSWIVDQQNNKQKQPLEEGAVIPLRGASCVITAQGTTRLPQLIEGNPQMLRLPGAPETLGARALRYLKQAAKDDLSKAVAQHSTNLGVKPGRITIRDTRTRWGSCSQSGNLSFSWRLIMADPFVLDYVAAHEVAHMLEMNHSPAFWAQVERTYPNWKQARNWLRANGDELHAIG